MTAQRAMLQWPFGEITGRVTASHRDQDGVLVLDSIEIDTVGLPGDIAVVVLSLETPPETDLQRFVTASEERIERFRSWLMERADAIYRQAAELRRNGREPGSIAVPARFGADLIVNSLLFGLPLVPADLEEPEVRESNHQGG